MNIFIKLHQARSSVISLRAQVNNRELRLTSDERAEVARKCAVAELNYRRLRGAVNAWRDEAHQRFAAVKREMENDARLQ